MTRSAISFAVALALCAFAPTATGETWAHKAKLAYATRFSVEYPANVEDPYKFVRFRQDTGDTAHVLYMTGTTQPDLATVATTHGIAQSQITAISVPVTKTAITSTMIAPFLEVLGETDTLTATKGADLTGRYRIASACVNKMYAEGKITAAADTAALDTLGVDVVFSDTCPNWGGACPAKSAIMSWEAELTMGAYADYIQLVSVYFNKEHEGLKHAEKIHSSWECVKKTMANKVLESGVAKPKVLWAYNYFGTWYPTLTEDTYKGEVTTAAGGLMMGKGFLGSAANLGQYGGMTSSDFLELAQQADVLVYDSNYTAAYEDPTLRAVIEQLPAFTNKRIYDVYQIGNAWFENRIIQPDMLAQDMLSILHPSLVEDPADLTFLRDVFTQPDVGIERLFPNPDTCTDETAPVKFKTSELCKVAEEEEEPEKEEAEFFESPANVALVCILCAVMGMAVALAGARCHQNRLAAKAAAVRDVNQQPRKQPQVDGTKV